MLELRDYQALLVPELREGFITYRSICLQMPTGSGKTAIAGAIALGLARNGRSLLALVHRDELVDQMCATLDKVGLRGHYGIIAASRAPSPWAKLQVASIQTLYRRDHLELNPSIVVVDEAHHAKARTWEAVLDRFPRARRLGMTATPRRLDGKPLGTHFDHLVEGPSIPWLVAHGWLAPTTTKYVPRGVLTKGIRNVAGDYSRKDLGEQLNRKAIAAPVKAYLDHGPDRRAIYFGINTQDSEQVAALFREHGVTAVHVDGRTPKGERRQAVNEFRDGHIQVFCNVDIAGEGTDFPICDCVLMGLPTLSETRYLQQAGRAMRPEHGRDALIIDLVANVGRHGWPDDKREWDLTLDTSEKEGAKAPRQNVNMRVCVHCATVYQSRRGECPSCGKKQPLETPKHLDIELMTRDKDEPITSRPSMAEVRKELRRVVRDGRGRAGIREVRDRFGLNPRWEENAIAALGL